MSNYLRIKQNFEERKPRKSIYGENSLSKSFTNHPQLNSLIKDQPAEEIAPMARDAYDALVAAREDEGIPLLNSMRKKYWTKPDSADTANPLADPTVGIAPSAPSSNISTNALADPTVDIGSPVPAQTNALVSATSDYWKTPVVGKIPLDKFVQMAGMTAHALDPKGFGGILGKDLAQYATTERDVEQKNALAKLTAEHTTLQNKKLQNELDDYSANTILKRRQAETIETERQRKMTRELIGDVDIDIDPTGAHHTATVEKLKAGGADVSLLPKIDAFKDPETGLIKKDDYKAWRDNYLQTADQKATASIADRKEKFGEITLYNKETGEEIKWSYEKPKKAGEAFSLKSTGLSDKWSTVKPKEPPAPLQNRPGQTRTFEKNKVKYTEEWAPVGQDAKGNPVYGWKALASSPVGTEAKESWTLAGTDEDGTPILYNSKTSQFKSGQLPEGMVLGPKTRREDSQLKIAEIESVINGKDKDGKPFGNTPGAAPYINWYNERDKKGTIYKQTVVGPVTTWYGRDTGEKETKLEQVKLPIVDKQQVTGEKIAEAVKQSKGLYTYDEVLNAMLSPDPKAAMKTLVTSKQKGVKK